MSLAVAGTRHLQALIGSLGRLARNPFSTTLTLLVIGLALSLPTGLRLFILNAQLATGGFPNAVDLSVYFKTDVPLAKAQQLARNARERADVASVELISSDKAMEEFRNYSGFGAALDTLKENPLPHTLRVLPRSDAQSPASVEALRRYFAAWPEVDIVQVDTDWVKRFNAIIDVVQRLLAIVAILLGAGVLAVIFNTTRLEILNRRSEIEVTKLVGGSNAFVRRPFLYTGALYGLGGALLAWAIVEIAVLVLAQSIDTLAALYGTRFSLQGPSARDVGILLAAGFALGWLGAWISAARHLWRIEPRA
ncbi:MAG TPA: permease-like cell division protein FtsX [Steroidobacteraceae bacterium]|nr:permease-like cell division protein FtsX [Steroidobacteraceae bacterium]